MMAQLVPTAGRYLRKEILGSGSTATVYRAHDQLLDRPVALKEIHLPNGQSVMLAEARAAAGISHQNVVTVHDVIDDETGSFIAMELLEGPTLAELLRQRALGPQEAVRIAVDIAAALDAAHKRGVVHCDIKPDNIFVTDAWRVVVTDFGLATPELGGGTPGYMAPEQYGETPASPAMDVFGWACVVVELFCGAPPFGVDPDSAPYRTTHEEPAVDPGPMLHVNGLLELVLRCLDKDPRNRPPDGTAVLSELTSVLALSPPMTIPTPRDQHVEAVPAPDTGWAPIQIEEAAPPLWFAVRLMLYPAGEPPWSFDIHPGDTVEIGRESTLSVPDPQMSRRHAAVSFDGTQLVLTDLGSMNGTYVNGHQVDQCIVVPGDVITLGSTMMAVEGTP